MHLRLLLVEDQENDAALIVDQLQGEGFEPEWCRVDREADFIVRLGDPVDIVLSDYSLPAFDGATALRLLRERCPDIPFIVISGTIGEERAVELMRQGADDYLLKDRLQRLGSAVTHAIRTRTQQREHQELEARLRQAQKMEAIGQLAGGIAHDFNNLLTAILGYAELLAPALEDNERQRKDLEEIRKAAIRATKLTGQLLAFSRRQILQPAVIDLNALVTEVAVLLGRLIGEEIRLQLDLDPSLGRTKADPGQIEQVIMNLAINARDAMPSGGTLTVQTMNVDVDDQFFRRHGFVNESGSTSFVVVSVSDTGTGIDPAVRTRIFEPFFTTKPTGKGTGLGLATVYGIVKQSGGSIWVYSEPGHGATFRIYLPRTDEIVAADSPGAAAPALLKGTETILLVEDEEAVRMLSQALLERQGYRVLVAANGEQAMRIVKNESSPIDLLVSDVVMPGKSGPELFEHLRPLLPDMRVLFLSGYADEAMVKRGVLEPGTPFLQKPFTATALSRKVREVLDFGVRQP